jgi:hypothetical protein
LPRTGPVPSQERAQEVDHELGGPPVQVARLPLATPAPAELVARSRRLLDTAVVIPLDLRYDDRDVAETRLALERVLPS